MGLWPHSFRHDVLSGMKESKENPRLLRKLKQIAIMSGHISWTYNFQSHVSKDVKKCSDHQQQNRRKHFNGLTILKTFWLPTSRFWKAVALMQLSSWIIQYLFILRQNREIIHNFFDIIINENICLVYFVVLQMNCPYTKSILCTMFSPYNCILKNLDRAEMFVYGKLFELLTLVRTSLNPSDIFILHHGPETSRGYIFWGVENWTWPLRVPETRQSFKNIAQELLKAFARRHTHFYMSYCTARVTQNDLNVCSCLVGRMEHKIVIHRYRRL
jgi:hypothetical protein